MVPHPLHEVDRLGTPMLPQTPDARAPLLCPDHIVNVMLIVPFPGVFLSRLAETAEMCTYRVTGPTGEHLPEYHTSGENVDFVIVPWVRVPEFWSLPIDCTDQTPDHGPRAGLHASQAEITDFRLSLSIDQDIG